MHIWFLSILNYKSVTNAHDFSKHSKRNLTNLKTQMQNLKRAFKLKALKFKLNEKCEINTHPSSTPLSLTPTIYQSSYRSIILSFIRFNQSSNPSIYDCLRSHRTSRKAKQVSILAF